MRKKLVLGEHVTLSNGHGCWAAFSAPEPLTLVNDNAFSLDFGVGVLSLVEDATGNRHFVPTSLVSQPRPTIGTFDGSPLYQVSEFVRGVEYHSKDNSVATYEYVGTPDLGMVAFTCTSISGAKPSGDWLYIYTLEDAISKFGVLR